MLDLARMRAFFTRDRSIRYVSVNVDEDKESSLESPTFRHPQSLRERVTSFYRRWTFLPTDQSTSILWLNVLLLCISGLLFWSSLREKPSLRELTSMPSPVLANLETPLTTKRMNAPLIPATPNIFQQEPSPEVDKAWLLISDTRPIPLSRDDVLAIGKDPSKSVRLPSHNGEELYAGRIDVLHQLHCLNALRQEAYFEHYYGAKYPGGFNDTDQKHRYHLSHCVYMLLQNILCHANTDVYTHIWTDAVEHPWPDFNIPHKCTDFRAILEWQGANAVDERAFVEMKRPGDQVAMKMSSWFKKVENPGVFGGLGDSRGDGENA